MNDMQQPIEQTYGQYGFIRVKHDANKFGKSGEMWEGRITFTSEDTNIDEIESARFFEAMVIGGLLPMHGSWWRLASINFNFRPTDADRAGFGAGITCVMVIGYTSDVRRMGMDEVKTRLTEMGLALPEHT